jgi:GGDEF domain-containing protein
MKKILVIGSCQARAIAINLNNLYSNISAVSLELNETSLSNSEIYKLIEEADLTLSFVLDEVDKWEEINCFNLKSRNDVILFPRLYFKGFFPDVVELAHDETFPLLSDHSQILLSAIKLGWPKDVALKFLRSHLSEIYDLNAIYANSKDIFLEKEKLSNIVISDLIFSSSNFPNRFFHTHRHPTSLLLKEFIRRIAVAIEAKVEVVDRLGGDDFIDYFKDSAIIPPVDLSTGIQADGLYRASSNFDCKYIDANQLYEYEQHFYLQNSSSIHLNEEFIDRISTFFHRM